MASADNKSIVPFEYDGREFLNNGNIVLAKFIRKFILKKLVDKHGKEIFYRNTAIYLFLHTTAENLLSLQKNGKQPNVLLENRTSVNKDYIIGNSRYYNNGAVIVVGYLTKVLIGNGYNEYLPLTELITFDKNFNIQIRMELSCSRLKIK